MATVDFGSILQESFKSALHSVPWFFWVLVAVFGIAKILIETAPKKRRCEKRNLPAEGQNQQQTAFNEKLMPCPDCNKAISMNASSCPHCGAPITLTYVDSVKARREQAKARSDIQKRKGQKEADESFIRGRNGCALATLLLFLFLVLRFTSGILMWILAALVALLAIAGLCEIIKLRDKGKLGEEIVKQKLANRLPKESYKVVNDIYLPLEKAGTTQIDHIVVSVFGVFVIETKNYSGWIFADKNMPTWVQVLGNAKSHFQNPIRQNYLHLCAIADDLGLPMEILHGIVAFADGCEFKTAKPEGVVFFNELCEYIQRFETQVIQQSEADDIYSAIREWNASVTQKQRTDHVENLRKRHSESGKDNFDGGSAYGRTVPSRKGT